MLKKLFIVLLFSVLLACQGTTPQKLEFSSYLRSISDPSEIFSISKSQYIQGVTNEQWAIIKKIGDPLDCEQKVKELDAISQGNLIPPDQFKKNPFIIAQSLSEHEVTILDAGAYDLQNTIFVEKGKNLIGRDGAVLNASNVSIGIVNNGSIKNIAINNAQRIGIKLGSHSVSYKIIVRFTGINHPLNSNGTGIQSSGIGSRNNCVVSTEVSHGYNEKGTSYITEKGGNADGFAVKFGAHNITFVDTHAHHNSDDGYDFWKGGWKAPINENDITIRIFYSSGNKNGRNPFTPNGDGNGFKFGSSDKYQVPKKDKGARFIYGSAACFNKTKGFDPNNTRMAIITVNIDSIGNNGGLNSSNGSPDNFKLDCSMFSPLLTNLLAHKTGGRP